MTLTGTGRAELLDQIVKLEARITELQDLGSKLVESRQNLRENIARNLLAEGHTALALAVRALEFDKPTRVEAAIVLDGWMCLECGVFTSNRKTECRSCGVTRESLRGT